MWSRWCIRKDIKLLSPQLFSAVSIEPTNICFGVSTLELIRALDKTPSQKAGIQYAFSPLPIHVVKWMHRPSLRVMGKIDMSSMLGCFLIYLTDLPGENESLFLLSVWNKCCWSGNSGVVFLELFIVAVSRRWRCQIWIHSQDLCLQEKMSYWPQILRILAVLDNSKKFNIILDMLVLRSWMPWVEADGFLFLFLYSYIQLKSFRETFRCSSGCTRPVGVSPRVVQDLFFTISATIINCWQRSGSLFVRSYVGLSALIVTKYYHWRWSPWRRQFGMLAGKWFLKRSLVVSFEINGEDWFWTQKYAGWKKEDQYRWVKIKKKQKLTLSLVLSWGKR